MFEKNRKKELEALKRETKKREQQKWRLTMKRLKQFQDQHRS
ncbi:hypothetical protein [Halalkalibacter urbisdiaboli]|nr:hypothetical protein [Halalkalibacter urbisdiaboli]